MKLVLFALLALLALLAPAAELSADNVTDAPCVAVAKRQKLVSLPKSRFKSESAAVREAERRNPAERQDIRDFSARVLATQSVRGHQAILDA